MIILCNLIHQSYFKIITIERWRRCGSGSGGGRERKGGRMMVMLVLFERVVECMDVECTTRDGDLHVD